MSRGKGRIGYTKEVEVQTTQVVYPVRKLEGKAEVIIAPELEEQIRWLHEKVGGNEWSGALIYEIIAGDIDDPRTLQILAKRLHLLDIGTSVYTEYIMGTDIIDIVESKTDNERIGHIH